MADLGASFSVSIWNQAAFDGGRPRMPRRRGSMLEWIGLSEAAGWWILMASAALSLLGVIAVPLLVVRIPADYFVCPHRGSVEGPRRHLWFHWIWLVAKNLVGVVCLFFGALMLVLPGQGVLTILLGMTLLDFPGKFRLERWVVSRRGVVDSINWARRRAGKGPLVLDK
jgi:hypothetical protein